MVYLFMNSFKDVVTRLGLPIWGKKAGKKSVKYIYMLPFAVGEASQVVNMYLDTTPKNPSAFQTTVLA